MMSDYHWLFWEMKNALFNSSHTALFVRVGTKPNSKPLTCNAFPLFFFFLSAQYCSVREEYLERLCWLMNSAHGDIKALSFWERWEFSLLDKICVFSQPLLTE